VDDKHLIAFDTDPGNALLDDWMLQKTGRACDENGAAARAGRVDEAVLAGLLSHPYFAAPAPKSLDRDAFASQAWKGLTTEDGAATLAAFTVRAVARGLALLPERPVRWIVCGGGRRNAMFMESLKDALGAPVVPIEDIGLDGDATEAEAFAYLAVRSLRGLPLSFPSTTGVSRPMTGGALHRAAGRAA
jgi:anhydro-N-acetylmuramic acid kinase